MTGPSPEEVAQTEEVLKQHNKTHEFHMYDGAGDGRVEEGLRLVRQVRRLRRYKVVHVSQNH